MKLKIFYSLSLVTVSSFALITTLQALVIDKKSMQSNIATKPTLSKSGSDLNRSLPAVFEADVLTYDEEKQIVTGIGNVYISHGLKVLRADRVEYDQNLDKVTARGNVWIKDDDGNYSFAQYVELTNNMDDGLVEQIKVLMIDDSRAAATKGKRYHGDKVIMFQGVYSPCPVCKKNPDQAPLWQLKGDKIIHDKIDQTLTYKHGWMELWGVPVVYTPYFYHPDPSVKRKTGLLIPRYGSSKDLGVNFTLPFFVVTGENHDFTFYPTITAKQGVILEAEHRYRFVDGEYTINGSYAGDTTNSVNKENNPEHLESIPRKRWHIFADARYDINDETVFKLEVQRASDMTYLRRFPVMEGSFNDITTVMGALRSSASVENYRDTSYGIIKGYVFQTNDDKTTPVILPIGSFNYQTMPGAYNETWHFDANILNLFREEGVPGVNAKGMVRGTLSGGMQIPYVSSWGDLWQLKMDMRGDAYSIHDFQKHRDTKNHNYRPESDKKNRLFPQASLTWRYPFVRYCETNQWVIEPSAMIVSASHGGNGISIPNEDSPIVVVETANLFLGDRFYGLDRLDGGSRFVYGVNNRHYFSEERKLFVFFGQSIRLDRQQILPITSGEDKHASNFVSSVTLVPISWLQLSSRLMFDRKHMSVDIAESAATATTPWVTGSLQHVFYSPRVTIKRPGQKHRSVSQLTWSLTTPSYNKWTFSYSESLDLSHRVKMEGRREPKVLSRSALIQYQHECVVSSLTLVHRGYRDRDLKPDTAIMLQFDLKNIGTVTPIRLLGSGGLYDPNRNQRN